MADDKWTKSNGFLSIAGIKYWRADWDAASILYVAGDGVHDTVGGKAYVCILEHVSDVNNQPGFGINWPNYWQVLVDCCDAGSSTGDIVIVDIDSDTSGLIPSSVITLNITNNGVNRGDLVQISTQQNVTVLSVIGNGIIPFVQEIVQTDAPNNLRTEQWSLIAPPVGPMTIVITLSAPALWCAGAEALAGVNQAGMIGTVTNDNGSSTNPNTTNITSANNSFVFDSLVTNANPITYTVGVGQGINWQHAATTDGRQGASSVEPAGTAPDNVLMEYTLSVSTPWCMTSVEIIGVPPTAGAALSVYDEGVLVDAAVTSMDFTGAPVTVTPVVPGAVLVTITGGATGTSLESAVINQVAHGFAVGDVIQVTGANTFGFAQANTVNNSEAVGIVSVVVDPDNFKYISSAVQLSGAFVPAGVEGEAVWLDPSVAGGMTTTEPTVVGQVRRGLGTLIDSGAKMYFDIAALAEEITGVSSGDSSALKVGVGSSDEALWFNIQYPFWAPGGTNQDYCMWDLSTMGAPDVFNPTFVAPDATEYFTGNFASGYTGMLPDGAADALFTTTKMVIFQCTAFTAATAVNANGGGLGFDRFASGDAHDSQGTVAETVCFVRRATDGQWFARTGDGVGFTETAITVSANAQHVWRIEYDPANAVPQARFYVDGALVATHTTNLNTADANQIGFSAGNIAGDIALTGIGCPAFAIEIF